MIKVIAMTLALAASALTHAHAQTVGYADAIRILANSCSQDIGKYCSKATLANFEIGDCLRQHANSLSGQCAADLVKVRQSLEIRAAAQADADRICNTDIRRLCPMTEPGRGHILNCLIKAEPSVSADCNQAITNAGWR